MSKISSMCIGMGIQAFMAAGMIWSGQGTVRQQVLSGAIFFFIAFLTKQKKPVSRI